MGKVYLVGAGPGDPELLTLKAVRILKLADVVVYDRLVSAEILAYANPGATFIYAGKQQGEQERIQNEINQHLLDAAQTANTVVRLKGGDPMVFGRGAEEWSFLASHGVEVEIVPGISSAIAAPALAGIPVTCRGVASSFAIIAGHRLNLEPQIWSQYAVVDTLVILMGVENRQAIAKALIQAGRTPDEPVAFVENGSTPRERVVTSTLAEVARGTTRVKSPAVFVAGQVVRLRKHLKRVVAETSSAQSKETVHAA